MTVVEKNRNYSLYDFISSKKNIDLKTFLQIALNITQIVGELHKNDIIYKYINPHNICIDIETKEITFIDTRNISMNKSENLPYMSPEQTGRMAKQIDFRTDFYSLGVIFYRMLTGKLPLQGEDELELTYSHIAKAPLYPHVINQDIPEVISDIIMKLLSKEPENRYKNAYGLKNDLIRCMIELEENKCIKKFKLGEKDFKNKFDFSEKLYGREKELKIIFEKYNNVKQGKDEIILMSGDLGIGKSTIMKEVEKQVVEDVGMFISGKCTQYSSTIPYSPIIQIANKLVRQMLMKSQEKIENIKDDILNIVGSDGKIIVDFIPELEYIIGKQSKTNEYVNMDKQNRFNEILLGLINILFSRSNSVVFFVDDFQWIDYNSLKFIEMFIKNTKKKHILFIFTYREDDIYKNSMMRHVLFNINKKNKYVTNIVLKPLGMYAVNDLICDTLHCDRYSSLFLAKIITYKTDGNPFFINVFLENMFNEHILEFDYEKGKWKWDINKILKTKVNENSLDLLTKKIKKLPKTTMELLKLASCMGIEFDLKILSFCNDRYLYQNTVDILPAIRMGIVSPVSRDFSNFSKDDTITHINEFMNKYMFCHDHIHERFYSMIEEEEKKQFHLKIGMVLLDNFSLGKIEINIFDVVNQLNRSYELIKDEDKIYDLVNLNLVAGKKVYASAAYTLALKYLRFVYDLLKEDCWITHYELSYEVYLTLAQYECINGEFATGEKLFDIILNNSKTINEKAVIYNLRIMLYTNMEDFKRALENGIYALKLYNINIPIHPKKIHIYLEYIKMKLNLKGTDICNAFDKRKSKSDSKEQIKKIFMHLRFSALFFDKNLFYLMTLKEINLILKYGTCENDVLTYIDYSIFRSLFFNEYKRSYEFGVNILNKYKELKHKDLYKAMISFGSFAVVMGKGSDAAMDYLNEAYEHYLNSSEKIYAVYAANSLAGLYFISEYSLDVVEKKCKEYLKIGRRTRFSEVKFAILLISQLVDNLKGKTESRYNLNNEKYYEKEYFRSMNKGLGTVGYYTYKLFISYLYGNLEYAKKFLKNCEKEARAYEGTFLQGINCIFSTLVIIDLFDKVSGKEKKIYGDMLDRNLEKMAKWSENCHGNIKSFNLLIKAKVYFMKREYKRAEEFLSKAMKNALKRNNVFSIGIICETYANFYSVLGEKELEKIYIIKAYDNYEKWGAIEKLKQLREEYPKIFIEYDNKNQKEFASNLVSVDMIDSIKAQVDNEKFDFISIIKASQAISREIVLEKLLEKLMKILIQNAGAQRGCLILKREDELMIEAEGDINEIHSMVSKAVKIEQYNDISKSVVNYVARTKQNIVLEDASKENMFIYDTYIFKNNIKSVLCSPIKNKGEFMGIIYLENNFATKVFSRQRLSIVNFLSSQAAISIENAYMYEVIKVLNKKLEKEVEDRTNSLNQTMKYEELRTEFFANISHELRTPLNVIFGGQQMLELILKKSKDLEEKDKVNKYMGTMKQNCYRLVKLINNLIDITKIDAGYFEIKLKNRNIVDIVESITLSVAQYIESNGINVTFDTDVEEEIIACDPDKIERIMLNLLSNALKFTEPGGNIYVNMYDKKDKVRICVKDDGIGIPKEKQKSIFERFIQVDKSLSRNREGSGIGLSIVKSLVELHGGTINLISECGKGSEFIIDMPNKQILEEESINSKHSYLESNKIERIKIEFSDIYS